MTRKELIDELIQFVADAGGEEDFQQVKYWGLTYLESINSAQVAVSKSVCVKCDTDMLWNGLLNHWFCPKCKIQVKLTVYVRQRTLLDKLKYLFICRKKGYTVSRVHPKYPSQYCSVCSKHRSEF